MDGVGTDQAGIFATDQAFMRWLPLSTENVTMKLLSDSVIPYLLRESECPRCYWLCCKTFRIVAP